MARQHPSQNASTQRHGQPAPMDMWEVVALRQFQQIRCYLRDQFRQITSFFRNDKAYQEHLHHLLMPHMKGCLLPSSVQTGIFNWNETELALFLSFPPPTPPHPTGKVVNLKEMNKTCFVTSVGLVNVNTNQFSKKWNYQNKFFYHKNIFDHDQKNVDQFFFIMIIFIFWSWSENIFDHNKKKLIMIKKKYL